jgi:hypothetical protein
MKFVKDLPMIDAQFRFNQCNSFREENISVFSTTAGHSFYIGSIGSFYNQVNDTGS